MGDLAATAEPITHEVLDALPASRSVNFVRSMLLQTGVLPARLEHLVRFGSWLDALLESSPAAHGRLIRPYAQWHVVHRARRRPPPGIRQWQVTMMDLKSLLGQTSTTTALLYPGGDR